jgi:hypothetical protein
LIQCLSPEKIRSLEARQLVSAAAEAAAVAVLDGEEGAFAFFGEWTALTVPPPAGMAHASVTAAAEGRNK